MTYELWKFINKSALLGGKRPSVLLYFFFKDYSLNLIHAPDTGGKHTLGSGAVPSQHLTWPSANI